ncbi:MAG: hypothetical protein ACJ741_20655 [Pyrinomonadaceae bacterium]
MSAKLTVIFYIVLCLEAGIVLTFLPWASPFGLSDWGDNFFLVLAAQKTGVHALQQAVSSGWVRGAVTGLGLLNLGMAFWEILNFRQTVGALGGQATTTERAAATNATMANARDASRPASPGELPR